MRRRILLSSKKSQELGGTMPVAFYSAALDDIVIRDIDSWKDDETPVGIVVVPSSHNRYGDESWGVMSLVGMDNNHPESGIPVTGSSQTDNIYLYWGNYGNQTVGNNIFLSTTALTSSSNFIPIQASTATTETKYYDTSSAYNVEWPYVGTPPTITDNASTTYSNTSGYVSATTGKSGCDFNGIRNTAAIYVKTKTNAQWTASTINNYTGTTHSPATCCVGRYKTIGTKSFINIFSGITSNNTNYGTTASTKTNTGFWYFPGEGELCYLPSKQYEINKTVLALNQKYGNVAVQLKSIYWSSSEGNSNRAWRMNMSNGEMHDFDKFSYGETVRAFMRLPNDAYKIEYEWVDLGLTGECENLLWCKQNVGAASESDYGDYYQWGSIVPYKNTNQFYTGNTDLPLSADTAAMVIGGGSRMPTSAECQALINQTTSAYTTVNGVSGVKLTGPNNNYVFFPFAGGYSVGHSFDINITAYYWSSTVSATNYSYGITMADNYIEGSTLYYNFGLSVRAVKPKYEYVDLGLSVKWAKWNVGAKSETDFGDYFAYGGGSMSYFEGVSACYNYLGTSNPLPLKYDTAYQCMGEGWRTPTEEEFQELIDNTTYSWTTINGVRGGKFTASNGNYVFFPAAGYYETSRQNNICRASSLYLHTGGHYWSSTPLDIGYALALEAYTYPYLDSFDEDSVDSGHSVRGVHD